MTQTSFSLSHLSSLELAPAQLVSVAAEQDIPRSGCASTRLLPAP